MIFNHSDITEPIDKEALKSELSIGSLYLNTKSKIIYTKNLNSDILDVGISKRYLSQFPEYEVGYEAKGQTSIAQFSNIDGNLKLTTKYPFFYLSQLNGTVIDTNTQSLNTAWLKFSNGNLINDVAPTFTISSLTEVSNLTLNTTTNNYALCAIADVSGSNFNKNPFISLVYYYWTLQPENTRLVTFDDVLSTKPVLDSADANRIIRTTSPGEGTSRAFKVDELNTGADKTPKLSNNLDCLGNSIFNVNYLTQRFVLDTIKTTIVCDCDKYKNFLVIGNPPTTLAIELTFNTLTALTLTSYIPFMLSIQNFNGIINFDKKVEFENGEPLALQGLNHLIIGMLLITDNIYKIRILQKSTNLTGVL